MGESWKLGSHGDRVKEIQTFLGISKDGVFGEETERSVKVFQKKNGLKVDGIVGMATLEKMGLIKLSPPIEKPIDPNDFQGPNPFKRASVQWYEFLYRGMKFDTGTEKKIVEAAKSLLIGKKRYEDLTRRTRVPWNTIAALHKMEGNANFDTYLGNGQSIHRKTTIVPIGRGPFATFEDGAMDALKLDGLTNVLNWSIGLELKYAEQFNGLGYMKYHPSEFSPYVWACSSVNDGTGKYTSDGHYDETANANAQVGVATMFKQLELMGEYKPVYAE